MAERRLELISGLLLLQAGLLAGCGVLPTTGEVTPQTPSEDYRTVATEHRDRVMNPATASLLEQGRALRRAGRPDQAAVTLERALRIDPNEPEIWLELAELRYAAADWPEAEQFARRARSLAPADSPVRSNAVALIADALDRQGRQLEAERLREQGV